MNFKQLINHKLVQAGSWYTFTNFFIKGIVFLSIPIFTRLLSPADYGVVSLFNTWVGLFSVFLSLDLAWSIQSAKLDYEKSFNEYISSILFLSLIIFTGFLVLFIIFEDFFLMMTGLTKNLFYLMVIISYFSFIQNFSLTKFRVEYNYKLVSVINILVAIGGVVLSIYLIKNIRITDVYIGKIIGDSVFIVLTGFIYITYFFYKGKKLIDTNLWKYGLMLSIPFILHNVSGVINSQFDRIIINRYYGATETGIYSFAYNIGAIINVIFMSFYQAFQPFFFEKMMKKEYNVIKKISLIYRDLFTFIYFVILFLSPEIIKMMAHRSYWAGLSIIPFIFLAYYFNFMYLFETNIEYYYKRTKFISFGTMLAAVINISLNLIFVPLYGYRAAAITTVISYFFLFIFHYYITSKVMKITIYGIKFHLTSLLYCILITISFVIIKEELIIRLIGIAIVTFFSLKKYMLKFKGEK